MSGSDYDTRDGERSESRECLYPIGKRERAQIKNFRIPENLNAVISKKPDISRQRKAGAVQALIGDKVRKALAASEQRKAKSVASRFVEMLHRDGLAHYGLRITPAGSGFCCQCLNGDL